MVFKIGPGSSQITVNNGQTITSTTLNSGGAATITTVIGSAANNNFQGQIGQNAQFINQNNANMGGIGPNGGFNQNNPNINLNMGNPNFNPQSNGNQPNINFPNSNQPTNNLPNLNQPNPNTPGSGFPGTPNLPGTSNLPGTAVIPINNAPGSVPLPGTQPSIDNLLNQFAPSVPADMPYNQPNNPANNQRSYPTPNLPTGGNLNAPPNTAPLLIDAAQAPKQPVDKNRITPDSVKATAIF